MDCSHGGDFYKFHNECHQIYLACYQHGCSLVSKLLHPADVDMFSLINAFLWSIRFLFFYFGTFNKIHSLETMCGSLYKNIRPVLFCLSKTIIINQLFQTQLKSCSMTRSDVMCKRRITINVREMQWRNATPGGPWEKV